MANLNNLKIEIENGRYLEYNKPEDLGIKLNRIVDDFQNPSKRFGEFSYTFSLPRTKNNDAVFEYPDVKGRTKIFVGKSFECKVFNNNQLLIDGIIELSGVSFDTYECQFYSRFTQLVDAVGTKLLTDLTYMPLVNVSTEIPGANFEKWVINHIEAGYEDCDEAYWQYPLIYYRTMYAPYTVTQQGSLAYQNLLNIYTSTYPQSEVFLPPPHTEKRNWIYYHQIPPAFYLVPIVKNIFSEAGWSLSGSWIERSEIKKIVIPYNGSGTFAYPREEFGAKVNMNKLLPKFKQIDFLKSIISLFNLYFFVDPNKKEIVIEDYNVLFNATDNPYDITRNVDLDTVSKNSEFDSVVSVEFNASDNNKQVGGDNSAPQFILEPGVCRYVLPDNGTLFTAGLDIYPDSEAVIFNNKIGGTKSIKIQFETPNLMGIKLNTLTNRVGGDARTDGELATVPISLPIISKQTKSKNEGYGFYEDTGDTFLQNKPDTMQYEGNISLMYYYGQVRYNGHGTAGATGYTGDEWNGSFRDVAYINIATGGTGSVPTGRKVIIPYASPYQLVRKEEEPKIIKYIDDLVNGENFLTYQTAELQSLLRTFYMAGSTGSTEYPTTPYSLILGGGDDLRYDTIYTYYHKKKYDNLVNSNKLKCKMLMNENDWREMTIDRPIRFNDELYRIISIKNYDPILNTASLELLKKV